MLHEIKNKLRNLNIFWQFVILGFVVFAVIGIFLSSFIEPMLTDFVLDQTKLNSSVFISRLAADSLLPEDFVKPVSGETQKRFENLANHLQFPGLFRLKIWNREGVIIYSDEKRLMGQKFALTPELKEALNLKASIGLKKFLPDEPHHRYEVPFGEGIEFYTPLTFGASAEVVGIAEVYGRSGFLTKQIAEVKNNLIWRIVLSLFLMYVTLSFIVWRGARLIRQRTERLETALVEAQAASRTKSEFLSIMSHELRTPLNSILGFVKLMLMGLAGPINAEQKKQLAMIEKSGENLLLLINKVLDLAKIEAGKISVEVEKFQVYDVCKEIMDMHRPLAVEKNLELIFSEDQCRCEITTDKDRFKHIILNLITNAIKFTERGSVSLICSTQPNNISLSIIDTGVGIKKEDFPKLFKPFSQIDMGSTREAEGAGLGLSIVKKNLELLGGEVRAESEFGKGSTFTVRLPWQSPPSAVK